MPKGRGVGLARRHALAASVIVATAAALLIPTAANATDCTTEETIFVSAWSGGYSIGKGYQNQVQNYDRSINTGLCGYNYPLAWSTGHLVLGNIYGNWIENGYYLQASGPGAKYYMYFGEWGINYTALSHDIIGPACTWPVGQGSVTWKGSSSYPTGTNWTLFINCNGGPDTYWKTQVTYNNTGYNTGSATGETGRFGGTVTSMQDYQFNLFYQLGNNAWANWASPICRQDDSAGWQPNGLSVNSYNTITGGSNC